MATKATPPTTQHQSNSGGRGGGSAAPPNAAAPVTKRKPVFIKVEELKPGTTGHNVVVKVVNAEPVINKKPRNPRSFRPTTQLNNRIAECLIGDETGAVLFTARNDQVDLMKPGNTVILRNARIDMFKGSMRLNVDKWGLIEETEPAKFVVKEDNNLSLVEYELVDVPNKS